MSVSTFQQVAVFCSLISFPFYVTSIVVQGLDQLHGQQRPSSQNFEWLSVSPRSRSPILSLWDAHKTRHQILNDAYGSGFTDTHGREQTNTLPLSTCTRA